MENKQEPNTFLKYSGLGLQLLISIGLAAWIGQKLDQFFELSFPAFLLFLVFGAFIGSMFLVYRSLNK